MIIMLKLLLGAASYTLTCKMNLPSHGGSFVAQQTSNGNLSEISSGMTLLWFHWESMWKIELMGQIVAQQYNIVVNIWISSRKKCGYLVLPVCWRSFASQKQTSGPTWSQLSCYLRKLGHATLPQKWNLPMNAYNQNKRFQLWKSSFSGSILCFGSCFFLEFSHSFVFGHFQIWSFNDFQRSLTLFLPAGVRGSATTRTLPSRLP